MIGPSQFAPAPVTQADGGGQGGRRAGLPTENIAGENPNVASAQAFGAAVSQDRNICRRGVRRKCHAA